MKEEFWSGFSNFVVNMALRFKANEKEKGDSWETLPTDTLAGLLENQLSILSDALNHFCAYPQTETREPLLKELEDTANRCATVWMRLQKKVK